MNSYEQQRRRMSSAKPKPKATIAANAPDLRSYNYSRYHQIEKPLLPQQYSRIPATVAPSVSTIPLSSASGSSTLLRACQFLLGECLGLNYFFEQVQFYSLNFWTAAKAKEGQDQANITMNSYEQQCRRIFSAKFEPNTAIAVNAPDLCSYNYSRYHQVQKLASPQQYGRSSATAASSVSTILSSSASEEEEDEPKVNKEKGNADAVWENLQEISQDIDASSEGYY